MKNLSSFIQDGFKAKIYMIYFQPSKSEHIQKNNLFSMSLTSKSFSIILKYSLNYIDY
jgi:hypothetical protein